MRLHRQVPGRTQADDWLTSGNTEYSVFAVGDKDTRFTDPHFDLDQTPVDFGRAKAGAKPLETTGHLA
jgi:hypothetical protein